jgi:hypothetical protein
VKLAIFSKWRKRPDSVCFLPRQHLSSQWWFNDGNSTEAEVGRAASSSAQSRLSSIWLSFVWTNEGVFKRLEIPE